MDLLLISAILSSLYGVSPFSLNSNSDSNDGSLWHRLRTWLGLEDHLLPTLLNSPPSHEDWFAYVNGILDHLEAHPSDDFRQIHHLRRAKARGKTAIFRFRQSIVCEARGVGCARLLPGFYYTGETDYYSSEEEEDIDLDQQQQQQKRRTIEL